jgi:serine/threonine protein kinase
MSDVTIFSMHSAHRLRATSALQHPNIVATLSAKFKLPAAGTYISSSHPFSADAAHVWLVQEFCNGGNLKEAVKDQMLCSPALAAPLLPVMGLLRGVAQGLAHMHAAGMHHTMVTAESVLLKVCSTSASCVAGVVFTALCCMFWRSRQWAA